MGFGGHFCAAKGNEFFCQIDEDYLSEISEYHKDTVDSNYLKQVPEYDPYDFLNFRCYCDKFCGGEHYDCTYRHRGLNYYDNHICYGRGVKPRPFQYDDKQELLYGLIHARYIMTNTGMARMKQKYDKGEFGYCPRVYCESQPLIPMGLTDVPMKSMVKMYCPKCEDIYHPRSSRFHTIDGAFFGTSFPHMFLMAYPLLRPKPARMSYVPTLYGFRIHPEALELQHQKVEAEELAQKNLKEEQKRKQETEAKQKEESKKREKEARQQQQAELEKPNVEGKCDETDKVIKVEDKPEEMEIEGNHPNNENEGQELHKNGGEHSKQNEGEDKAEQKQDVNTGKEGKVLDQSKDAIDPPIESKKEDKEQFQMEKPPESNEGKIEDTAENKNDEKGKHKDNVADNIEENQGMLGKQELPDPCVLDKEPENKIKEGNEKEKRVLENVKGPESIKQTSDKLLDNSENREKVNVDSFFNVEMKMQGDIPAEKDLFDSKKDNKGNVNNTIAEKEADLSPKNQPEKIINKISDQNISGGPQIGENKSDDCKQLELPCKRKQDSSDTMDKSPSNEPPKKTLKQ